MQINVSKSIDFIISKYDSCEKILYIYTFDVTVNEDPNILDGKDGKIIRAMDLQEGMYNSLVRELIEKGKEIVLEHIIIGLRAVCSRK